VKGVPLWTKFIVLFVIITVGKLECTGMNVQPVMEWAKSMAGTIVQNVVVAEVGISVQNAAMRVNFK
jgi:hypothetical protein